MNENEEVDDMDGEEYDEQIEQAVLENGLLLHTVTNLLVKKGVLRQEEIEEEMEKLYKEMDSDEDDEE